VLIDANIFIYALTRRSDQCRFLLSRCERDEVVGITTAEIVSEVCHRLMLIEAAEMGVIARPSAVDLRRRRAELQSLTRYWTLTSQIWNLNISILPLNESRHRAAQRVRTEYGLLTNDSLIVAAAEEYDVKALASRDDDFDQVRGLTVYKPTDLA
jgi:predicted nucleic acid-binding protein